MDNRPPPFLKKIYLSRREIKMILDAVDDSEQTLDKSWKEEMVSKLKRAIRRSKRKEKKVAKKDENETQS
tara:strand:- start:924 stop:1133 length:210 start_codon:yes stop_codon:yes gene_type:complete